MFVVIVVVFYVVDVGRLVVIMMNRWCLYLIESRDKESPVASTNLILL